MIPANPTILPMPFAQNGDKNVIATTGEASQPNATWSAGFPAITRLPKQAGGLPPLGLDFNGLFNILTQHLYFLQSGGVYPWAGADAASGFAGLDYLAGARVLGSDGAVYVALKGSGPNTPAASGAGFVGPVDPVGDTTGVWSSLGGALLYNREETITASGTWEAPVTGWYDLWMIGGGDGAYYIPNHIEGGDSGNIQTGLVYLTAGETVDVIIGQGGTAVTADSFAALGTAFKGGYTSFGTLTTEGSSRRFVGVSNRNHPASGGLELNGYGGGVGGAAETSGAYWYGAGGGGTKQSTSDTPRNLTGGYQGAVIVRYYDPAYAAGPVEAASAAQADVAALEAAPVIARMSARRVGAAPADTPAEDALVSLYDPETGNGSVWRAEDVPAKVAGGMLSEEAWRERCEAKAAEEHAAWLVDPATEAERFAMLRAARDAKLAATDYLMAADYPLSDEQRAAVAAYRQALRDLPEKDGAPWDGGGDATPWPDTPGR